MEMWHWRAAMVAILAIIVCISSLSSFSPAGEGEKENSRLFVVNASPRPSETYLIFFRHFDAAILRWREMEPEPAIRNQWVILVLQEDPSDEDGRDSPIIIAVVDGNGEEGKTVVVASIAPGQIPAAAFVAAKKTIQIILDSERTERAKKML